MGFCPICKASADLEQPPDADYLRVGCRKCGKFQITGTAQAILTSRLSKSDKKAVARLSHATRMMSTAADAEWAEINSVNLDSMIKQPLPPVDRQMTNLLVWAAAQLGDDHLGTVELPDEEDLTGVIGTLDGSRVDDLISRTQRAGLIELVPDNCVNITDRGWERIRPPTKPSEVAPIPSPTHSPFMQDRIIKAHCNKCHGIKNSWVRAEHTVDSSEGAISWSNTYEIVQCCGCDTLSVRHEYWFSEWDYPDLDEQGRLIMERGTKETYYPPPTVRTKPTWSDKITDSVLSAVLNELYLALNVASSVLASVGARTLLDRAGYLLIGDPKGGFEGKLAALVTRGFISAQEKEILDAVADAGNASAHRGYTPTPESLAHIIDIIENFLQRAFVLKPAADDIRKSTPPRPK
jgi:uncharacterized protein DUF4145